MDHVLIMLEALPPKEVVLGCRAKEAAARLRQSLDVRARLLAEQSLQHGQSMCKVYSPIERRLSAYKHQGEHHAIRRRFLQDHPRR